MSGSTPAARSLLSALLVDSATLACCQTRAATPTTAASSASRSIAGRANSEDKDPVARFVVEEGVEAADLDRHPERAKFILVALEGALECSVAEMVIALDRLPDPALGKITA